MYKRVGSSKSVRYTDWRPRSASLTYLQVMVNPLLSLGFMAGSESDFCKLRGEINRLFPICSLSGETGVRPGQICPFLHVGHVVKTHEFWMVGSEVQDHRGSTAPSVYHTTQAGCQAPKGTQSERKVGRGLAEPLCNAHRSESLTSPWAWPKPQWIWPWAHFPLKF